jgi:hypothetical protein
MIVLTVTYEAVKGHVFIQPPLVRSRRLPEAEVIPPPLQHDGKEPLQSGDTNVHVFISTTGQVCPTVSCTFKSVSKAVLLPSMVDRDKLFVTIYS